MCTSLVYRDLSGKAYLGRTLELTVDLPYQIAYFPKGFAGTSQVGSHPVLSFSTRHSVLAITMPSFVPSKDTPVGPTDLKVIEGLNEHGLNFSLLSYPSAAGPQAAIAEDTAVLGASDLGLWILGSFTTVAEAKEALSIQPLAMVPLPLLGGAISPFHYVVNDASGSSLVIEFHKGVLHLYDNPVRVMTNGPRFDWHLTNLDNYTFLSNVDHPTATFGDYRAAQPDAGVATSNLPASNTSVGRFVRAAYYAQFAEKAATPDKAVLTLAHVLNNFDRPKGATIDLPSSGGARMEVEGLDGAGDGAETEYTCWTSISDFDRKSLYLRPYDGFNYTRFDIAALSEMTQPLVLPFQSLEGGALDGTNALKAS